mgnify:CR=1 FL=1
MGVLEIIIFWNLFHFLNRNIKKKKKRKIKFVNPIANKVTFSFKWFFYIEAVLFQLSFLWNQTYEEVKWHDNYLTEVTQPEITINKQMSSSCVWLNHLKYWSTVSLIIRLSLDTLQGQEPVALYGKMQLLLDTVDNRINMFELSYSDFQITKL